MFIKQALCIGVNAYLPSHLALEPCINDARDLARSLTSIGFNSHFAGDTNLKSMQSITDRFVDSIQPDSVALYYFSGHGVQYDGHNYLIPTNAVGISADNIKSTAIDAQKVIDAMHKKRPRLVICILDCCRTDPPAEPIDGYGRFRKALAGTQPGFAPMQAPPSTIIVYACAADDVASPRSKNGRNSLYTYHLLNYIRTPNVDIEAILRYVAMNVAKDSKNTQIPFRYSSCNEDIYLAGYPGHKALMPSRHRQTGPFVQPVDKYHRKGFPVHHSQSRRHRVHHQLNDRHAMPMNYPRSVGYPPQNMMGVPSRSRSHFSRTLWHY